VIVVGRSHSDLYFGIWMDKVSLLLGASMSPDFLHQPNCSRHTNRRGGKGRFQD
jgi:hypothetical protein